MSDHLNPSCKSWITKDKRNEGNRNPTFTTRPQNNKLQEQLPKTGASSEDLIEQITISSRTGAANGEKWGRAASCVYISTCTWAIPQHQLTERSVTFILWVWTWMRHQPTTIVKPRDAGYQGNWRQILLKQPRHTISHWSSKEKTLVAKSFVYYIINIPDRFQNISVITNCLDYHNTLLRT